MKLKDWLIAGRFFAAPWILVNTLFGVVLAGFNLTAWLISFLTMLCLLAGAHYMNGWRDYVRGVDTLAPEGSVAKIYTAASRLIPEGKMTVADARSSAIGFFFLAGALFLGTPPLRLDRALIFLLGLAMAVTYTDFWKPRGLPEPALFIGHGIATTAYGYALVRPITMTGLAGGAILGIWAGFMTTIDQWQDIKHVDKPKTLAEVLYLSKIPMSAILWFIGSSSISIQLAFTLIGWLPQGAMASAFVLPLVHVTGIYLDYNFDKGVILGLTSMWLYAILASLGALYL